MLELTLQFYAILSHKYLSLLLQFNAMSIFSENLRVLRNQKELSQQKLADALIITRAALSKYEEGKSEPPLVVLSRMAKYFHISIDVLIGVDLHKIPMEKLLKMEDNRLLFPITIDKQGRDNIEIVPLKAKAGYMQGYSDPEFVEQLPMMQLPFLSFGKYRAFPIEGDSMPPHGNGSFIVGKYIEQFADLKEGKTYIVLLRTEGVVYKRLFRKAKSSTTFIFRSDNPMYADFEVKSSEILELWEYACSYNMKEFPQADENHVVSMLGQIQRELQGIKGKMES